MAAVLIGIAVVTALLAAAAILPLGASAHLVVVRTAAPGVEPLLPLAAAAAAVGAAVAPLVVAAPRLARLMAAARAEGGRALRSELAMIVAAAIAGALGHAAIEPLARDMGSTSIGAGLGLLATSVAIGSVGIAPQPSRRTATAAAAALGALGVVLGALPGMSPVALALAALAWSGLAEADAVEIAAVMAVPVHATMAARALASDELSRLSDAPGPPVLAGAIAVGAACVALVALRRWARTRTVSGVALWTGGLGLALLGNAYVAAP
jgi:undecaprenyl pyrophosphate phosphatase UppP